jgi:hypothetical protein
MHSKQHRGFCGRQPRGQSPPRPSRSRGMQQTAHFAQFNKESTRESSQCAHRHHGGHVLDTTRNSQGSALALALCTSQELLFTPRTFWNTLIATCSHIVHTLIQAHLQARLSTLLPWGRSLYSLVHWPNITSLCRPLAK